MTAFGSYSQSWTQCSVDGYGSAPCSAACAYPARAMKVIHVISIVIWMARRVDYSALSCICRVSDHLDSKMLS